VLVRGASRNGGLGRVRTKLNSLAYLKANIIYYFGCGYTSGACPVSERLAKQYFFTYIVMFHCPVNLNEAEIFSA